MAAISLGTAAVGGGIKAFGALSAGDANAKMMNYKAGVAQANAVIAEQNATYETQRGGVMAERAGIEGRQKLAAITSAQAASGFDINAPGGSAGRVRTGELAGLQQEGAIIRNDAARRSYGYEVQKMGFQSESAFDVAAAKNIKTASYFDAAGSLLGGASSVSDKWVSYSKAGVFS
jgi:hypothetical protein